MLKFLLFLNSLINVILGIMSETHRFAFKNIDTFNFIMAIFTLEPKLRELYSDSVNTFCPCRTSVRRRQNKQIKLYLFMKKNITGWTE